MNNLMNDPKLLISLISVILVVSGIIVGLSRNLATKKELKALESDLQSDHKLYMALFEQKMAIQFAMLRHELDLIHRDLANMKERT